MILSLVIDVCDMNASGTLLTAGMASAPRASVGFMDALERKLSKRGMTLGKSRRVAVGVKDYKIHGSTQYAQTVSLAKNGDMFVPWRGAGQDSVSSNSMSFEAKASAQIHLIIKTDTSITEEANKALTSAISNELRSMRFNGGSIFMMNPIHIESGSSFDDLKKIISKLISKRIHRGCHFLILRNDLIAYRDENTDPMDALISALCIGYATEEDCQINKSTRNQPGWIVAVDAGYQGLLDPIEGRAGSRDKNVKTVMCAPMIGLGEFISTRVIQENTSMWWYPKSEQKQSIHFFKINASTF